MSYNLLKNRQNNYEDQYEDKVDLQELLAKFYTNFRFTENKVQPQNFQGALRLSEIEQIYNQQDELEASENWKEIVNKTISNIHPDFQFSIVLKKIGKGQALEINDAIQVFNILNNYINLKGKLVLSGTTRIFHEDVKRYFKEYIKECELLFDFKTEELISYKHPSLKPIDKKIQETSKEIRVLLSKISLSWQRDELLQQNEFDVFDDKFVLPVRSDRFNSSLGKIIHRSKTGNTLFVEPHPLRNLSNELEEFKALLEREIYKLLKNLSLLLFNNLNDLRNIFHYLLNLDKTTGRLSSSLEFHLNRPKFLTNGAVEIFDVFNPLVESPVKNNVRITSENSGLLISGPNTGGKTVLLKSLCLCFCLPHFGFRVPASEASISYQENIFFMSHDNQSLLDGLSSFSSEAIDYLKTINEIKENGGIVFIDEIFNTTSSVEASQLATALIKELINLNCLVFISSHHESLKDEIFKSKLLESGHMGFEKKSNTPTYIFHHGSPGKSFAKEVFIGLEKKILDFPNVSRWLGEVSTNSFKLNESIQSLDEIQEATLKTKKEYDDLIQDLKVEKNNIQNLLFKEKQKLQREFDRNWGKLKKETLDIVEKAKKGSGRNIVKVTESLNELKANLSNDSGSTPKGKSQLKDINVGDYVFVGPLNKDGKILKINKSKAYINASGIKSWVSISDLFDTQTQGDSNIPKVRVNIQKDQSSRGLKFDARGMRREEFLKQAESYILDVVNGDLPFVDIIHGHGDGILKKSLNELLNQFKDDVKFDHIEGNMGTTRVELLY